MIKFNIDVGDWSGDGHSRIETFCVEADAIDMFEVRKAYANAAKKYPDVNPEKFCCESEENTVPEETVKKLEDMGCPELCAEYTEGSYTMDSPKAMAEWVVWFINLGASREMCKLAPTGYPTLRGSLTPNAPHRDDYINPSFGYGLFY